MRMIRPPYLARVAAGAAVYILEETRKLPSTAVNTADAAFSQMLQTTMHFQQFLTSLAIKGDQVFAPLFGEVEEKPEWATFDEDNPEVDAPAPTPSAPERRDASRCTRCHRTLSRRGCRKSRQGAGQGTSAAQRRNRPQGRRARDCRLPRLRLAHACAAARPPAVVVGRGARCTARLRRALAVSRAVPDHAEQSDCVREGQVTEGQTQPRTSNSAENPWPVRSVATKVAQWIDRLGAIWIEGQITQINIRPGTRTAFIVLRDRPTCPCRSRAHPN